MPANFKYYDSYGTERTVAKSGMFCSLCGVLMGERDTMVLWVNCCWLLVLLVGRVVLAGIDKTVGTDQTVQSVAGL